MAEKMRSGQFARLCGTSKDTLRHYENIGLLTPVSTLKNGYKEYLTAQAMDFMIISALKDAGCSLAEIKRFQEGNKEAFRKVMAESMELLDAQIADLRRKRDLLAGSIARIDELETWRDENGLLVDSSWRIRFCEQTCYIETQVPLHTGVEEAFEVIADHAAYCKRTGCGLLAEAQQASYRIDRIAFTAGKYGESFFLCTPTLNPINCDRKHIRPAGFYLQQLNALPLKAARNEADSADNPVFETYDALKALAKEEGAAIVGSVYDAELSLGTIDGIDLLWKETSVMVASAANPL